MTITHVFLDLDGVVRLYDNSRLFDLERDHGLKQYTFFSYAFEKEILEKAVTGKISDDVWKQQVKETFQKAHPDLPVDFFINALWNSNFNINYELLNILKDQFPDSAFFLATNATSRLESDLSKTDVKKYLDGVVNSSEIGLKKPDTAFFEYIRDMVSTSYRNMLFIDDSEENIAMSNKLGIQSFLYTKDNIALKNWINTL